MNIQQQLQNMYRQILDLEDHAHVVQRNFISLLDQIAKEAAGQEQVNQAESQPEVNV